MIVTDFARLPWQGIGSRVDEATSMSSAMRMAGLDFTVEKTPSYVIKHDADGDVDRIAMIADNYTRVPNDYFIRRRDTGHILGRCGKDYTPLQNVHAFDFFQPFLDDGTAKLHTAGVLQGGQKVWILAEMVADESIIADVDVIKKFILLVNSHDAKSAVLLGFTPIRFFCTNMLTSLMGDKDSQMVRIRHHQNVEDAVVEVRRHMKHANEHFEKSILPQYQRLAARQYRDNAQLCDYIIKVFDLKPPEGQEGLSTRSNNKISEVLDAIINGYGNTGVGVRGTWWAAYNGVTQYLNYSYGRNADSRLNALWFGAGAKFGKAALKVALDYCMYADEEDRLKEKAQCEEDHAT